jgi:hypothetical protein
MNRFYTSEQISEHISETPEGFWIAEDVPVAKIGEQTYKADEVPIEPNDSGLVLIKRREEEVFNPDAIKSFEGKPFTIDHPDEMVTPENWMQLAHGFITNVRRGIKEKADLLVGDIVITTKKAIELVKNGMREISCGYDADYEQLEKGVGIQKNIIGNHIALVMKGRAGSRCAIGDKDCNHCGNCKNHNNKIEEDDDAMKFKDKLKAAYRKLVKDEDFEKLPDDEKADKLAETAVDAVEEEGNLGEQPLEEKPLEEKPIEAKDEGEGEDKLDKVIRLLEMLLSSNQEVMDSISGKVKDEGEMPAEVKEKIEAKKEEKVEDCLEPENKPFVNKDEGEGGTLGGTPSGSMIKKPIMSPGVSDEEDPDDKEEREKTESKDCDSVWMDVAYRADLLLPGIRLTKPTKDHKIRLESIKRKALTGAYTADSETVKLAIGNHGIESLRGEALDIAFLAASNAVKEKNNKFVRDSVVSNTNEVASEIRSMNEKHKKFWSKENK